MTKSASTPDTVYVFDLDGVITDPTTTSIDTEAIRQIHTLLEHGTLVAVNTGRSYVWVEEYLLIELERLGATRFWDHLLVVCEKGGECIEWLGQAFVPRPSRFALPEAIREQSLQLFMARSSDFSSMFWDKTKVTMATFEKYPKAPIEQFSLEQEELVRMLQAAFKDQHIRIEPTISATDIELPEAGKHAGAELIYQWAVEQTGKTGHQFISFGDSKGDYEMARYFAEQGNGSTFVFVGHHDITFDELPAVQLLRTKARYSAGTKEYFAANA